MCHEKTCLTWMGEQQKCFMKSIDIFLSFRGEIKIYVSKYSSYLHRHNGSIDRASDL